MKLEMYKHSFEGKLITFCGLDGCGKTSQIKLLHDYLIDKGYKVFLTKQPTNEVRKSDIFRTFMDKPDNSAYDYRALSLLAASDRLQHTEKIIKKHLENGEIVISDRYFYSCLANLHARGCFNDKWIYEISKYIINPDFAFFLNVDVEVAISRVRLREEEKNRYINLDLQYALHKEYLEIAKDNGIVINSQKDMEETFLDILYSLFNKQEECEAYNLEEVAI